MGGSEPESPKTFGRADDNKALVGSASTERSATS